MSDKPILLAEKPSQAKAYADAFEVKTRNKSYIELEPCSTFRNGAIITWAIGHLVELQPPQAYGEKYAKWHLDNLPILPNTFKYQVAEDKKSHFNEVKKLLLNAGTIVIGTDIDREGELISRALFEHIHLENKNIKRLWINSLEKDEVRRGMNNLIDAEKTYNYFVEAQSRQQADWLVGMNLSPLFSLLLQQQGFKGSLSIGRVQSPTVYLIYQRQKEIENFKPESFYEIVGEFKSEKGTYKGKADVKEFDRQKAQDILNDHKIGDQNNGNVESVDTQEKRQKSPKLHSLSTLQSKANKRWKYSPKKVLDVVQGLYDKKILSYPRTDCNHITENEFNYLVKKVSDYQSLLNVSFQPQTGQKKRYVDNSKVEEHYAIIPTRTLPNIDKLSEEEKNIYYEVLATTLAMFHEDYIYNETTIMTNVNDLLFKTTGKTEKNKGWKSLFPVKKEGKEDKEEDQKLPNINEQETVQALIGLKEGETKPPKPYSEGQLINAMKTIGKHVDDEVDEEVLKQTEGIGTEATRSGIIEQIKKKQYIEVKKNIVYVTKKGEILCQAIEGTLLSSPTMTAKWEAFLTQIGKGQKSKKQFLERIQQFIQKMIDETPNTLNNKQVITDSINEQQKENEVVKCPSCGNSILDKGKFYGCSGYKDGCKVTFPNKLAEKNLTKTMIKTLCEKKQTNELKGFKSKKGYEFKTRLILNDEYKIKFDFGKEKSK